MYSSHIKTSSKEKLNLFSGGGEMGSLIREKDWSKTPLGDPKDWPQSLRTMVSVMLDNPFAMYIAWGNEYIQLYNNGYRPILGSTKHPQALGISTRETFSEIWHIVKPMFDAVMEGEAFNHPDFLYQLNRNGFIEDCYFDFAYSPVRKEDGKVGGVLVTVIETTNKRKVEDELKKSEERFRDIVRQTPVGMVILRGRQFDVEMANNACLLMIDKKENEFVGKPLFNALPGVEKSVHVLLDHVLDSGIPYHGIEYPISINRHGQLAVSYFDFICHPLIEHDNKISGIIVTVADVSLKVLARTKLEEIAAIVHSSNDAIISKNLNGIITSWNPAAEKIYGYTANEMIGQPILKLIPADRMVEEQDILARLRKGQRVDHFETKRITKDNRILDISLTISPIKDSNGNVIGASKIARDITRQKQAEQLIKESEKRFRLMVEQAPVALSVNKGDDLIFDIVNRPMIDILGRGDSIKGKAWYEAIPELVGQPIVDQLYHTYHTGEEWEGNEVPIVLTNNGQLKERYFNLVYRPLVEDGKINGLLQSAVDVTEQVNARKELEQAKDTLKLALSAAELGTFDVNLKKGSMFWDERCRTLFGISHNNPVSYEVDFVCGLHPDDRERVLEVIKNVYDIKVDGGNYDVEYRTVGADDKRVRWIRAKGKAYFDENEQPVRFIGAVLDITDQKTDEIRKNDFIAMVSHELKTPLTILNAVLQIASLELNETGNKPLTNMIERGNVQVKRMTGMIKGFLDTARLESGKLILEKQLFDINQLLGELVDEIRLIENNHEIDLVNCNPVEVNGDRDKISSVISNLLNNAVKYSPNGKPIIVNCERIEDAIIVSVRDEGIGIKQQELNQVFERFYRAKAAHSQGISGFGIGLYVSAEIIKQHNGRLWAESEQGVGSTFYFTLPL